MDASHFVLPNNIGISVLDCKEAFALLSQDEKLYAHFLSRASWYGGLIVLMQTSPESPGIFVLLSKLFRAQGPEELKGLAQHLCITEQEYQALLVYTAGSFANMGNYKSFGDTKFIPNLPKERLKELVFNSAAFHQHPEEMKSLWETYGELLYSLEPRQQSLGLGDKGTTTYFSENCTLEDAELAQRFLDSKNISAYNTRLFKSKTSNEKPTYEIRLASANTNDSPVEAEMSSKLLCFDFEGKQFTVNRGDYAPLMKKVVENLQHAKAFAANLNEEKMLEHYIRSFTIGSIDEHKQGSRFWVKDKGPIVESYIGFIESYRDPFGSRGEFEGLGGSRVQGWRETVKDFRHCIQTVFQGFVAVVNKAMSARFGQLVASAEQFLQELPWPKEFEKDHFLKPDFTSLDVLTFSGSGIPAGINIPNYDDIRQKDGFKNVSLGNVLSVAYATEKEKLTFLAEEDKDLYLKWKGPSFEVQVGLHELLGHGSGKLFVQDEGGTLNFDQSTVINPETGELIRTWYKGNETWDSKFSTIASTYEECRAECVGLYLCFNKDVLKIFGLEGVAAEDVIYVNWLNMVRAGLLGLEFYTPETKKWRQSHMQARFAILRVLLEAGDRLVTIQQTTGADGKPDAVITLDRAKILSVGKPAIEKFLRRLQVFKSTADVEGGRTMFEGYCTVTDDGPEKFLTLRQTVLQRKEERKMFVQANTRLNGAEVQMVEYEGSAAGLIQSFIDRFPEDAELVEKDLIELSQVDAHFWNRTPSV